jgi:hypothetical protein
MCMKSCALVTTPNAWCVPRSLSLLTTNSDESTQIVGSSRSAGYGGPSAGSPSITNAGSMLPVAIACSAVAISTAIVARTHSRRIASCAASASGITSGSGPSSRIDPHSTNGTPHSTSACMMPSRTAPCRTASAIDPAARTRLIARMCSPCPPAVACPVPLMPSVVPKIDASMSCTATALPARNAPTKPFRTNHVMSARAREWTSAGPATHTGRPPRSRSSTSSRAMCA